MKQLLTLLLALIFISLYSCKKEEDKNTTPKNNDSTEVEDTIKTFDSTQIKIDKKYANIKWEELNLTDTCVIDICFECGNLDRSNQAFYNQLQTAFETDCEDCLLQGLTFWFNQTQTDVTISKNDTINEINELFTAFINHNLDDRTATKYVLFDFKNHVFPIRYNTVYKEETDGENYNLTPHKSYKNLNLLDKNILKEARDCYSLMSINNYSYDSIPQNLRNFSSEKSSFLNDKVSDFKVCDNEDQLSISYCKIAFPAKIQSISFLVENREITKAKLNVFHGDYNDTENWMKDANGNWVKEVSENKI